MLSGSQKLVKKLKQSSSQSIVIKTNLNNKIRDLINKNFYKKIDFDNEQSLKKLNHRDIQNLLELINHKLSNKIIQITYPFLKRYISKDFTTLNKKKLRPSLQCKYIWPKKDSNFSRKTFYKNDIMYESLEKENFCFPTRPHQDFENNGFRSINTLIFYIQLTKIFKNTSDLLVSEFKQPNQIKFYKYNKKYNYYNQIHNNIYNKIHWTKKYLSNNSVFIMNGITPHCSDLHSKTPRLAVNFKIHPTNLEYLFNKKEIRQIKSSKIFKKRLLLLKDVLKKKSKNSTIYLPELAIVNYFLKDLSSALNNIKLLYGGEINSIDKAKHMVGFLLKKNLRNVNDKDISLLKKYKINAAKFSNASNVLKFLSTR